MNYSLLKTALEKLEIKWFRELQLRYPCIPAPLHPIVSGYAQFFSIEHFGKNESRNEDVSVIVALGINYFQGLPHPTFPSLQHWLNSQPPGTNWVEDPSSGAAASAWPSSTRKILDLNLRQYLRNKSVWEHNHYASKAGLVHLFHGSQESYPYILICTNLSPFLTQQRWTALPRSASSALLAAWDPNLHLCDFLNVCGDQVDCWVAHGKQAIWPQFNRNWRGIRGWLMTHNLNPLTRRHIPSFWKTPNLVKILPQLFPTCDTLVNKTTVLDQPVDW